MSKHKMIEFIKEQLSSDIQRTSISAYVNKKNKKYFDFESYFEMSYESFIKNALLHLDIKDLENYRHIFHKHHKAVFDLGEESVAVYTSNKKNLFNYWAKNKNIFLEEIMDIYKKEKDS